MHHTCEEMSPPRVEGVQRMALEASTPFTITMKGLSLRRAH